LALVSESGLALPGWGGPFGVFAACGFGGAFGFHAGNAGAEVV
jgi:hypothetical protein